MRVFKAMLIDAYRELNARKLFWITLAISGLVVLFYASIGFDQTGMFMFFGLTHIESEFLTAGSPLANMLYRSIFSTFIVGIWLAWAATILAIISTTTIFPDFVAGGAIDLVLCKPISRVKLFFVKYVTSLLFVLMQVTIFCVGVFICMGWRLGDWNPIIFAAIPLITVFYSYLYSINVLVGVWTRSALAALLATMLFWFSLFGVNVAEVMLNNFMIQSEVQVDRAKQTIADAKEKLEAADLPQSEKVLLESEISNNQMQIDANTETAETLENWHRPIRTFQAILPKTGETIGLLDRWLKKDTDVSFTDLMSGNVEAAPDGGFRPRRQGVDREVEQRMTEEIESRSIWYVIGTSLLFEAVVLGLACWVFVRRDY